MKPPSCKSLRSPPNKLWGISPQTLLRYKRDALESHWNQQAESHGYSKLIKKQALQIIKLTEELQLLQKPSTKEIIHENPDPEPDPQSPTAFTKEHKPNSLNLHNHSTS